MLAELRCYKGLARAITAIRLGGGRPTRVAFLFLLGVALASPPLWAQGTGSIGGHITDPDGAAIPDAVVTARNAETGFARSVKTNSLGNYEVSRLSVGNYLVIVEHAGFKTATVTDVVLHIDESVRVDVSLQLGELREEVVVSAAPPLTATTTAEIGDVIEERRVQELPLSRRNVLELSLLAPGAAPAAPGNGIEAFTVNSDGLSVSINGGRMDANLYLLDGVYNQSIFFNQLNIVPTVDAVAEFRVKGSLYDAESGYGHGGVINFATKSGTNEFHGKVWEFLRNDDLDARNFFDDEKPPFRQNQFGFSVGGPISRDRTYFFGSYEGLRVRKGLTALSTLPTAAQRVGDFSADAPIFDPLTTREDPANPGQFIRDPFPGNVIPPGRIHPASAFLVDFLPIPATGGVGNFISTDTRVNDRDQFNMRVDHRFSDNDQVFGRFTFADSEGQEPFAPNFLSAAPPPPAGFGITQDAFSRNLALGWIHIFSPNLVNEFRFGFNRARMPRQTTHTDTDFYGMFNIPGANRDPADFGFPHVSVVGFSDFGDTDIISPFFLTETDFQYTDNLSLTKGRHSWKFGFTFLRMRLAHRFDLLNKAFPTFSGGFTTDPQNPGSTGNSFADFLLGTPTIVLAGVGTTSSHSFVNRFEVYGHDTWRATPKLTLSWGLRYEVMRPPLFEEGISILDDETGNIVVHMPNDGPLPPEVDTFIPLGVNFVTNEEAGFPDALVDTDANNFAPRFGFAYDLAGDGETVIRGGYGIFFVQRTLVNSTSQVRASIPFFSVSVGLNAGVGGLLPSPPSDTPTLFWDDIFTNLGALPGGNTAVRDFPLGYVQQYTLNIQRQLFPDTVLEIDYIGSTGRKLDRIFTQNQVDVLGQVTGVPLTRPFPQLGDFIGFRASASSNYNALVIKATQRMRAGLTFQAGYTWSKSIDTASDEFESGGVGARPQNSYDERAERGRSTFDTRHRFILSYLYELPVGPGKPFLQGGGKLLEGWRIGGIVSLQTGVPLSPVFAVDPTGTGTNFSRPHQVCDPNQGAPHSPEKWFNTECFERQPDFTYGSAGRNTIDGPGITNVDFAIYKTTSFQERYAVEFRTEFFNIFNTTNFLLPNRVFDSPSFGRVFRARDPRIIQFSLAFSF